MCDDRLDPVPVQTVAELQALLSSCNALCSYGQCVHCTVCELLEHIVI